MKFSASEVYQFGIRIEENGQTFYNELSEKLDNKKIEILFRELAKDEIEHKKIFQDLLDSFEDYNPTRSYPDNYFRYLKAYADNIIFSDEKLKGEIAKINDVKSALSFAIGIEDDSISYYTQIKEIIPKDDHKKIDQIIKEERRHYLKLVDTKKQLNL